MSDQHVHRRWLAVLGILVIGAWSAVGLSADDTAVRGDPPTSADSSIMESVATTGGGDAEVAPVGRAPLPSTHSIRIAGSTPKPRNTGPNYQASGSGGCAYVTAIDANTVWNSPLALPQGATVNILRMYYNDTSATDSTAWFTIYDLYGSIVQEFSVSTSGSSGNGFTDSALIDHQIDYGSYSYVFNWRPNVIGSTMQLCGFRIFYFDPNIFSHGFNNGDTFGWSAVVQ